MQKLKREITKKSSSENKIKPILRISNYCIHSKHDLGLFEQKFICAIGFYLQTTRADTLEINLSAKNIIDILHMTKSAYKQIEPVITKLLQSIITIRDDKGWTKVAFFSKASYEFGTGKLNLVLTQEARNFFFDLIGNYSKLEMTSIISQNSAYALKMYTILKGQYQLNKTEFVWSIEELREIFNLQKDEYSRYSHFKSKILLVIQRELQLKTEIAFDFTEIKTSRQVTAIKFVLRKNTPQLLIPFSYETDKEVALLENSTTALKRNTKTAYPNADRKLGYLEFVDELRHKSTFGIGKKHFLRISFAEDKTEKDVYFDNNGLLCTRGEANSMSPGMAEKIYRKLYEVYLKDPDFSKKYFVPL